MPDSRSYSQSKLKLKVTRQTKIISFLSAIIVAFFLVYVLRDKNFTQTQDQVLFLLFLSIGFWITEAIPPFAVGIMIVGFLVFTMGTNPDIDVNRYVQTWSDGVIWLFLGGFFLAEGMKKTRLDTDLLNFVLPKLGNNATSLLFGLMGLTAVLSMLMSNTATTSMIIASISPLLTRLGKDSSFARALLVGIPAASSIGGMGTIIGSAPNAIAVGALQSLGYSVTFIQWMIIGVPIGCFLTFLYYIILTKKYNLKKKTVLLDFLDDKKPSEIEDEDKTQKRIVMSILGITLLLWLTSQWTKIPVSAVSGIPIVLLTMFGIIDAEDVRKLPWETLMLVAGGLSLGLAIQEQGLAQYFINNIKDNSFSYVPLTLIFSIFAIALSNFMSNTATTTILVPIGVSLIGVAIDGDPRMLPVIIGLSASCSLLLPISTPPNAVAFSTGLLNQKEFLYGGIIIGLIAPFAVIAWTMCSFLWFF